MKEERNRKNNTDYIYTPPKTAKEREWHWTYNVILFGLFVGLASIIFIGSLTVITHMLLSKILIFCCVFLLLIPWKYTTKYLKVKFQQFNGL